MKFRTTVAVLIGVFLLINSASFSQKKPLDHTVYDGWESLGEKKISNNGEWISYTVMQQEGDGKLILKNPSKDVEMIIDRGYDPNFSHDDHHLIFKIKPLYRDTRDAKIKKKKPEDFPKDSLGILSLSNFAVEKIASVSSYKLAEKNYSFLAYVSASNTPDTLKPKVNVDTAIKKHSDTSKRKIPIIIEHTPDKRQKRKLSEKVSKDDEMDDVDPDLVAEDPVSMKEGTDLVVVELGKSYKKIFKLVSEYVWSENGKLLAVVSTQQKKDKSIKPQVALFRTVEKRTDTIFNAAHSIKNISVDANGYQVAFLADVDSAFKSTQKFYKLFYWQNGDPLAAVLADRFTVGMNLHWTVSEHFTPYFSRKAEKLFFGTMPIPAVKDTTLIDMDLAKLDVWHYNDDYLQPYQLKNLEQERKRSYLAMIHLDKKQFIQLADPEIPQVLVSNEGDGNVFLGITDKGKRIPMQWEGTTLKELYAINPINGQRKAILKNFIGQAYVSPSGKFIYWYDMVQKGYFTYLHEKINHITKNMSVKLYDEEHDMPSHPTPYGIVKWIDHDDALLVYDRYDIWRLDPMGVSAPVCITKGNGRKLNVRYRYIEMDAEKFYLDDHQAIYISIFNEKNKHGGLGKLGLSGNSMIEPLYSGAFSVGSIAKAKNADRFIFTKESFNQSPNLFYTNDFITHTALSNINQQQSNYNWMDAELFTWKAYNGKQATGIVYKPEDFQPGKKYPLIVYFYETLSDGLFNYLPPAPTPSRLNIPFFVSRGYIVLAPDIHYTNGAPGKSAFDYVVSGARALVKKGWVDSTKMGLQGQSWGGYQAAYIITKTKVFAAAWAGAPVANMTSAYGGIRWESGMNRQFQYEKSQSRIGATLWEKLPSYIDNSPLFSLPKVTTPLVIMSNDADGAVPWYQGIEMFTAMRRLGKQVWLLNYNGEAHNLVERRNRKDIQIREQQFFDWKLKGEKPTIWLTKGIPAVEKGINWGLETDLDHELN